MPAFIDQADIDISVSQAPAVHIRRQKPNFGRQEYVQYCSDYGF
jgi:hypothetical protein